MKLKYLAAVSLTVLMTSLGAYADENIGVKADTHVTAPSDNKLIKSVKSGLRQADASIKDKLGDIKAYFIDKNKAPGEKLNPILMRRNMTAHGMIGNNSVNVAGEKISAVQDIIIDKDGKAILVVVADGGVLGIGEKVAAFDYNKVIKQNTDGSVTMALSQDMVDHAADFSYDRQDWAKAKVIPAGSYSVESLLKGDVLDNKGKKVASIENMYLLDGDVTKVIVGFDKTFGVGGDLAALNFNDLNLVKKNPNSTDVDIKLSAAQSAQFKSFKSSVAN